MTKIKSIKKLWKKWTSRTPTAMETTVETTEKLKTPAMSDSSLEAAIEAIRSEGCCARGEARDLYKKGSVGRSGKELIDLYRKLESHLHSYCSVTGSSYTKSNASIVSDVLTTAGALARTSFETADRATIDSAVRDFVYVIRTGGSDLWSKESVLADWTEVIKEGAKSVAGKGKYIMALTVLDRAPDAEAKAMAVVYFPKAVEELKKSKTDGRKLETYALLASIAGKEPLATRAKEAARTLKRTAEGSLLCDILFIERRRLDAYEEKHSSLLYEERELSQQIEKEYTQAVAFPLKHIATFEQAKVRLGVTEYSAAIEKELAPYRAIVEEKTKEKKSKIEALMAEPKRRRRETEMVDFEKSMKDAATRVKDRTMGREEYRRLHREARHLRYSPRR